MKKSTQFLAAACLLFIITSCEKEKDEISTPVPDLLHGVFIVNEGAFGQANASVSFASSDSAYYNADLYSDANGFPVGDLLQSLTIHFGKGYLCVNNSQKVEVVSMSNFKKTATITGINSPRYMIGDQNNGYISDWGTNSVFKINLLTNTISGSVTCGSGPEEMLILDNKLYVCNGGGFGDDSTVTVIDLNTFSVSATISTGVNPSSIRADKDGRVWILCKGSLGSDFTPTPDDAGGKIIQLDPATNTVLKTIALNWDQHPIRLNINGNKDRLYFLLGSSAYTGSIFSMSISDNSLPGTPVVNREFYSLGVHPASSILYAGKSSFTSNTHYLRYTMNGSIIDSTLAGIGPNSFVFN